MLNVLLTGVGGQGTVLAAKVLAQTAQNKGWKVRTAETIGMAQRGGSVVSHVRMGSSGEPVHAPLVAPGTADAIIAFEPGEAARALSYLRPDGVVISAMSVVQPVTAALASVAYSADQVLGPLQEEVERAGGSLHLVDDAALLSRVGNRRALNTVLLASAVVHDAVPFTPAELKEAIAACVKPRFVQMNQEAVDAVVASVQA